MPSFSIVLTPTARYQTLAYILFDASLQVWIEPPGPRQRPLDAGSDGADENNGISLSTRVG